MSETTFAIIFYCACALFLVAVGYLALGVLAKFYAFIRFVVRLCLQDPKFSPAMFVPACILSLYIALFSTKIFSIYLACAEILLVFCVCFDFLCLSAAKANAKLLDDLSAKNDLSESKKLAKEALERLANSSDKEEALLQANIIRMETKQARRAA